MKLRSFGPLTGSKRQNDRFPGPSGDSWQGQGTSPARQRPRSGPQHEDGSGESGSCCSGKYTWPQGAIVKAADPDAPELNVAGPSGQGKRSGKWRGPTLSARVIGLGS